MPAITEMIESYEKHKNLKIAAGELGMQFQTLYWHLKKAGVPVCGDKERYGSVKDRFGAQAERLFAQIVPFATDMNSKKFQSKVDFDVGGIRVEVKAAKRARLGAGSGGDRWAFSIRRQVGNCDFYVLFAFDLSGEMEKIFLVPGDLIVSKMSISISCNGTSKWHSYEVSKQELANIFREMIKGVA